GSTYLTIMDPSTAVPQEWVQDTGVGCVTCNADVYKQALGYDPMIMTVGANRRYVSKLMDSSWNSLGSSYLTMAANASSTEYYYAEVVDWWTTIEAIYAQNNG